MMELAQRPPYHSVDFKSLSKTNEDFKAIWQKSRGKLDFQDPQTTVILSKGILKSDFGLQLEVPDDRLCPPIPNRWNYVAWIHGLLDSTSQDYTNKYDPNRQVVGLDIGTGASAIYTMLCLQSRPKWTMCATDVDKKSFDSAARNLALNNLMTRTKLLQSTPDAPLIPLTSLSIQHLDFTLCNPPFFTSAAEMQASIKGEGKTATPFAACTGAEVEMVCPDGDLGFVKRMVEESLVLREKVHWYTSLLGKLDSAKAIVSLLKSHGIENWAVGIVDTGGSTKRWIVAWSFGDIRPRNSIARLETIANEYLPFPTSYAIPLPSDTTASSAKKTITTHLSALDLHWTWNSATSTGLGEASQNVWSRAYRRAHAKRKAEGTGEGNRDMDVEKSVALAFRVTVVEIASEVHLEWVRGRDRVLWESLCGVVHRLFKKA